MIETETSEQKIDLLKNKNKLRGTPKKIYIGAALPIDTMENKEGRRRRERKKIQKI